MSGHGHTGTLPKDASTSQKTSSVYNQNTSLNASAGIATMTPTAPSSFNVNGKETLVIDSEDIDQCTQHSLSIVKPPVVSAAGLLKALSSATENLAPTTGHKFSYLEVTKNSDDGGSGNNNSAWITQSGGGVELAQTLGSDWPQVAGPAGEVLNNAPAISKDEYPPMGAPSGRIKSANLLNHLGNRRGAGRGQPMSRFDDAFDAKRESGLSKDHLYGNVPASVAALSSSGNSGQSGGGGGSGSGGSPGTASSSGIDNLPPMPEPLQRIPNTNLEVNSLILVSTDVIDLYGTIKWIGLPAGATQPLVGVELEDELHDAPLDVSSGTWFGRRLFQCGASRGLFVLAEQCLPDTRFGDPEEHWQTGCDDLHVVLGGDVRKQFGNVDCPIVEGRIEPMSMMSEADLTAICGQFKGIQGHHNSCYLDATLFGMFAFTRVFDAILYRPANASDIADYAEIQRVLCTEIVNPLRKSNFVRADRVLGLRKMLEDVCSVKGLTSEEKDPEEFLNILLAEAMKAEPFLQLNSGQEAFCYQLFADKVERLQFPNVQQLFDQSFLTNDIKLLSVPNCLILQMPRFGKAFKMYPRILPSLLLDVTDVIANSPRQCHICGMVAHFECKECFADAEADKMLLENITFCRSCWSTPEKHKVADDRSSHIQRKLSIPEEFTVRHPSQQRHQPPRIFMELFAVVCIETSHYVSFVKTGPGDDAPWCFFDSMADRQGAQQGCNIPQLVAVPDLPGWLSETGATQLHEKAPTDKQLPKLAKRLLCDAYLCMYQSKDMMMYQ